MRDSFEKGIRPQPGRTLVVGSKWYPSGRNDRRQDAFPNAVGLDMLEGEGVDIVHDLEHPLIGYGWFAHIECLSVLEHARRPWLVAQNMEDLLVPGGTMYVRVPFVWRQHGYPNDYFRFTMEGAIALFSVMDWEVTAFLCGGKIVTKVPVLQGMEGRLPFFARTEVALFGRRRS